MKNLAIIPIRLGSKRLPKKNIRLFSGKPLFMHTVEYAIESGLFDKIHISTESEEVVKLCRQEGIKIDFMRPVELARDQSRLQDVCEFVIKEYENRGEQYDNLCLLWATAPMRTHYDIENSYSMLSGHVNGVVGVTEYDLPVFCAQKIDGEGHIDPLFPDMLKLPGAQMPKAVCDNGSLCWVKMEAFKKYSTWLPPKMKGYHMSRRCSVDIDTEEDWHWAEYLYKKHFLEVK